MSISLSVVVDLGSHIFESIIVVEKKSDYCIVDTNCCFPDNGFHLRGIFFLCLPPGEI